MIDCNDFGVPKVAPFERFEGGLLMEQVKQCGGLKTLRAVPAASGNRKAYCINDTGTNKTLAAHGVIRGKNNEAEL